VHLADLAITIVLTGFVLWNSTYYAKQMFAIGRASDMARVPVWITRGAVAVGFGASFAVGDDSFMVNC